jgi:hypothetical protein
MSRPSPQVPGRLANCSRTTPSGALPTRCAKVAWARAKFGVAAITVAAEITESFEVKLDNRTGLLRETMSGLPVLFTGRVIPLTTPMRNWLRNCLSLL